MTSTSLMTSRTYTALEVLTTGVAEGWADPETNPARIDWKARQARAAIPFEVIDGRPVNPFGPTGVRYGRNQLGHWGEALAADALVLVITPAGERYALMVERDDGHGWAIPGGHVEPGEPAQAAAVRELEEETRLRLDVSRQSWRESEPRYVPDPRASDEAWMVTVLCVLDLGTVEDLPLVEGHDDAARAGWIRAASYEALTTDLAETHGVVFPAHVDLLKQELDGVSGDLPVSWDDFFAKGTLADHLARWQALRDRGLTADAIATLKARGTYDAAQHPDAAAYPPLTPEDYLELLALGEAITRHVRHPSDVHQAVTAGATWAQVAHAVGESEHDLRHIYRRWARGQHDLYMDCDGKLGMSTAEYTAALARAAGERR